MYKIDYYISNDVVYFMKQFIKPLEEFNDIISNPKIKILDFTRCESNPDITGIPSNIIKLVFGRKFNQPLGDLPNSIKEIDMSKSNQFNYSLDNLPSNLLILKLSLNYSEPLNNLPESLEYLELGSEYNKPLENLPSGLKTLRMSGRFNQPLRNLPNQLTVLELSDCYDQTISELPLNLKSLRMCFNISRPELTETLPSNLEILTVFNYRTKLHIEFIPSSLKKIIATTSIISNIEELEERLPNLEIEFEEKYDF